MAAHTASTVRAAAFLTRCLSLAKTCSMGFRSGEYFGRKNSLARVELLIPVQAAHQNEMMSPAVTE